MILKWAVWRDCEMYISIIIFFLLLLQSSSFFPSFSSFLPTHASIIISSFFSPMPIPPSLIPSSIPPPPFPLFSPPMSHYLSPISSMTPVLPPIPYASIPFSIPCLYMLYSCFLTPCSLMHIPPPPPHPVLYCTFLFLLLSSSSSSFSHAVLYCTFLFLLLFPSPPHSPSLMLSFTAHSSSFCSFLLLLLLLLLSRCPLLHIPLPPAPPPPFPHALSCLVCFQCVHRVVCCRQVLRLQEVLVSIRFPGGFHILGRRRPSVEWIHHSGPYR